MTISSSWSKSQSAPGRGFADWTEFSHFCLQKMWSPWFRCSFYIRRGPCIKSPFWLLKEYICHKHWVILIKFYQFITRFVSYTKFKTFSYSIRCFVSNLNIPVIYDEYGVSFWCFVKKLLQFGIKFSITASSAFVVES